MWCEQGLGLPLALLCTILVTVILSEHVAELDATRRQGRAEVVELIQLVLVLVLPTTDT